MRLVILFFVIFISILLFSCTSVDNDNLEVVNETADVIFDGNATTQLIEECVASWKCVSSNFKAYLLSNCTFVNKTKCKDKCLNDNCEAAETCEVGWVCVTESKKAYQDQWCAYSRMKTCEWGCKVGLCMPAPAGTLTSINDNASDSDIVLNQSTSENYRLSFSEMMTTTVSGVEHNISLYNLEADRAIIKVDDWKSDWIPEKGNFSFSSGVMVIVNEILFQSYPGGKKEVSINVK